MRTVVRGSLAAAHRLDAGQQRKASAPAILLTIVLFVSCSTCAQPALGLDACSADDIIRQDPSCPSGTGACTISKVFAVADRCILDFGTRNLSLSGTLAIRGNFVGLNAGSLTIVPGGFIDGRSDDPETAGGEIDIVTSGSVTLQRSGAVNGRIDVSGGTAGTVDIEAGGNVTVAGRITGDSGDGASACFFIDAGGDIVFTAGSAVSASGGITGFGGDAAFNAGGNVTLADELVLTGTSGGTLAISAVGAVVIDSVRANSVAQGDGGSITIDAASLQVTGILNCRADDGEGASGGSITLNTFAGNIYLGDSLLTEGGAPDGNGGDIKLDSEQGVTLAAGFQLSSRGNGADESFGGDVSLEARDAITLQGKIDSSGGALAGNVAITSGATIALNGLIDASGRNTASAGGNLTVTAGPTSGGAVSVTNTIDVTAGGCDADGCGSAGNTDFTACSMLVGATAIINANAPEAGSNDFTVKGTLTVNGSVRAAKTTTAGTNGINTVTYRQAAPPVIASGKMNPPAVLVEQATCSAAGQTDCLDPCPQCGNSVIEYPETCDGAVSEGCCNSTCQLEQCDDGLVCTIESCAPMAGCRHMPAPSPCEEPAAPTPTPVPTPVTRLAMLRLLPQTTIVGPGEPISVDIQVEPNGQPINRVDLSIHFDRTLIMLLCNDGDMNNCLDAGSALRIVSQNYGDPRRGRIDFHAADLQSLSEPFFLARIHFVALDLVGVTPLQFVNPGQTSEQSTNIYLDGVSYFAGAVEAAVAVSLTPTVPPLTLTPGSPTGTPTLAEPTASVTATVALPTLPPTPTATTQSLPTASATPTVTLAPPTATLTALPSPSATARQRCTGDCSADGEVTVDEIVRGVNIALGTTPVSMCDAFDSNMDGEVTIDEIVAAVNAALNGCPSG
jgi:hypothetical protein